MQVHFRHPDRIKENWNARYIELLSWYSDVERTGEKPVGLLAKVEVEGSNPFARSIFLNLIQNLPPTLRRRAYYAAHVGASRNGYVIAWQGWLALFGVADGRCNPANSGCKVLFSIV